MKAQLSASKSVCQNNFFSRTADTIFMKFHINFWFLKDKKVIQPGKNLIFRKKPKISLKLGHFSIGKKIVPLMRYFWINLCIIVAFMILQKPHVLEKSLSIYKQKCSQPIILQDFLSLNITETM